MLRRVAKLIIAILYPVNCSDQRLYGNGSNVLTAVVLLLVKSDD